MADPGQRPKRISEEELAAALERWVAGYWRAHEQPIYLDPGDGDEVACHLFDVAHRMRRERTGQTL